MSALDPEVAAGLAVVPPLPKEIEAQRKLVGQMSAARPPAAEDRTFRRRDVVLPAAGERPDLRLRVYEPDGTEGPRAGLLYFHSGGFSVGDLDVEDAVCLALCRTGSVVVSVDYRLAPEHTAPAPVVDGYDALVWLNGEAAGLGIAPGAVGVCGLSAGGGIAAAVALMARDRGGPAVAFQILLSPALDDRRHWPSCRFDDVPLWNRADTEAMWERYLGSDPEAALPYGAPGRAKELHDLPPAYVVTGELDPMRDAAIDYATRLLHAGVSVELHVFPGAPHGWDMFCPKAGLTKRALAERAEVLRRFAGLAISRRDAG
ncbi:MAG TPA: alpha/beta hydrolase [Acidimicrobiia bacterium]|nr:alpha/beta hydrolase [Acidimicrobiia bacterium]